MPPPDPSFAVATCELRSTPAAGLDIEGVIWFALTDSGLGNSSSLIGHVNIVGEGDCGVVQCTSEATHIAAAHRPA